MSSSRPLVRTLVVPLPVEDAWAGLADVATWPRWAPHIRSVEVNPPGPVGRDTAGTFDLVGAPSARFTMTDFAPPDHWTWQGRFLWLTVDYDHRFAPVGGTDDDARGTEIAFVVTARGLGGRTLGSLFATAYARRLDAALPRLRAHLAGPNGAADPTDRTVTG